MRKLGHITPKYIKNRLASITDDYLHPNDPWLTRDSIKIISSLLRPTDVGVEFGSGRSTKWFLGRIHKLTSIESDRDWYNQVVKSNEHHIQNKSLDCILATNIDEYEKIINNIPDGSVDFILIDGKFRDFCAVNMLPKLKPGGVFVVDNINRYITCKDTFSPSSFREAGREGSTELWNAFLDLTKNHRYIWTTNGVTDTGIWI